MTFTSARELLEKITLGEDSNLELKEVRFRGDKVEGPTRDAFSDEVAAFANAKGGTLVLGVDDTTREVLGIARDRLDAVEAWVGEVCNDAIEPPPVITTAKLLLSNRLGEEVAVLKVDVPKSLFVHRSKGGYYHRVGSSKRIMSTEYLGRLMQQRSQARLIRFDEQAVPGAELGDLDDALWARFRTPRSAGEPRDTLLHKLRLAYPDAEGVLRPSVAGVLLATRDPRRWLPNAFIQAVAYRGTAIDTAAGAAPYQLDARDITGPIDEQVLEALRFVERNVRVPATKVAGRVDHPPYDLTAVFEALVNAVAHRDYAIYGMKVRLRLFDDRLEIHSPGALTNTMTVESLPLLQSARNEVLTSLLARCPIPGSTEPLAAHRTTFMDRRGEGVSLILDRSEALSGKKPSYELIADQEVCLTIWAALPS
jgi:ATP-dependent DNA helicase RecG